MKTIDKMLQARSDIVRDSPTLADNRTDEGVVTGQQADIAPLPSNPAPIVKPAVPHSSQYLTQQAVVSQIQAQTLATKPTVQRDDQLLMLLNQMQVRQNSSAMNTEGLKIGAIFLGVAMFFGTVAYGIHALTTNTPSAINERIIQQQQDVIARQAAERKRPVCILAFHCPDSN